MAINHNQEKFQTQPHHKTIKQIMKENYKIPERVLLTQKQATYLFITYLQNYHAHNICTQNIIKDLEEELK